MNMQTNESNIWQLSQKLNQLDHMIEIEATENGGEISSELAAAFEQLVEYFNADDVGQLLRKLRSESEMFAAQAKRFQQVATHRTNAMKELKVAAMSILNSRGVKKDGPLTVCGNGGLQPMEVDEENVPKSYIKMVPTINYEKIRTALSDGKKLKFAVLKERGKHLRVKG